MKSLFAIMFATLYGLLIRILFGFFYDFMEIMSVAFLILTPAVIGFLTIILTPKEKTKTGVSAFFKPWITSLVILAITILVGMEGTICWIMIYPFFAILAGLGGLIAYSIRKYRAGKAGRPDEWEKPDTFKTSLILLLPMFAGLLEGDRTLTFKELNITEEVVIAASPAAVWSALARLNEIRPEEKHTRLSNVLGFPHHVRTTLDTLAVGGKRVAFYEKGLYFEETISGYERERTMVLDIKTDPGKIPPDVMDEHILIGGRHIDILRDVYRLEQLPDGTSRLTLSSRFFINTPINWYAGIWVEYLMSDILQGELSLIKKRATTPW